MRPGNALIIVGLLSLGLVVVFAGSSYAQQASGTTSYDQPAATQYTDTVLSLEKSELQASVSNVWWRGGGHWRRPYWRHNWRPYWRRYWRPYYSYGWYYGYRPYPRCWWNGWRWICPPRRVVIY
ncbi:MAG: hypothetical protein ACLP5H_02035 [Desulfomonilaceae bacterium]